MMDRYQRSPSVSPGHADGPGGIPGPAVPNLGSCIACCLLAFVSIGSEPAAAKPPGGGGGPPESTPISLEYESYYFRLPGGGSCLGEDDELEWLATGSLAAGESFTFTPAVPACNGHAAAITVVVSWEGGSLSLSSEVPDADYSSWDGDQAGQMIQAPQFSNSAQLCMFPWFNGDGLNYTIKLRNNSQVEASNIRLHGRHENDWAIFYYPRCLNADADGDGWNDSLEHSMGILVYPNVDIDGEHQPYILWGSNYLRDRAETLQANDEIDSYPPDLNDDGWVDEADLSILDQWIGEGNGTTLEEISPNPGPLWFHENTLPWRRYDLDGDGYVAQEDRAILQQLQYQSLPPQVDTIAPTARLLDPLEGTDVPRGEYVMLRAHAWDNASIERVEYRANGKLICSVSDSIPSFGFTSPLYFCWWDVPKRRTSYELEVRAFDHAGNWVTSEVVNVAAQ